MERGQASQKQKEQLRRRGRGAAAASEAAPRTLTFVLYAPHREVRPEERLVDLALAYEVQEVQCETAGQAARVERIVCNAMAALGVV